MRTFAPHRTVTKRVGAWLATYEWWLVGIAAITTFIAACVGIRMACQLSPGDVPLAVCTPRPGAATGNVLSTLDVVYLAAQLFVWQSGGLFLGGNLHWTLDTARFLAPLVLGYAAIRAVLVLFSERLQLLRAVISRNHVIICGHGNEALTLARRFHAAGWRVITIAGKDRDAPAHTGHAYGAVLRGSASDAHTLTSAGLGRARHLIAIDPRDVTNAEICAVAMAVPNARRDLTCHAHIGEPALWEALRTREVTASRHTGRRLQFFNSYDLVARSMMAIVVGASPQDDDRGQNHLLLVGWSAVSERVILHVARWWRVASAGDRRRPLISVVDGDATRRIHSLADRYPALQRTCELAAYDIDVSSSTFYAHAGPSGGDGRRLMAACITATTDAAAIAATRRVLEESHGETFPVVVCASHSAAVHVLLGDVAATAPFARLAVCPTPQGALTPELVLDSTNEILARAIHDGYRREQERAGRSMHTDAAMKPWETLPEGLRESNRQQADHIIDKLDALGCLIVPQLDWDTPLAEFTADEVERLARWEHDRWMQERQTAGWRHDARPKNVEKKTSPYLTEWERLPEPIREIDRQAVRAIPSLLARVGVGIVRRKAPAAASAPVRLEAVR